MTKVFVPKEKDYLKHLKKYADFIRPAELTDWCAKISPFRTKRLILTLLKYKNSRARVLDLGCGIGLNTVSLAKVFPQTIACDVDKKVKLAVDDFLAKFKLKTPIIIYDGKKLPFKNNSFDLVVCNEVYEHAPNTNQLLKEIKRVMKSDGILNITAPNKLWPIEGHYHLWFLSYLPKPLADKYVRLFKKGSGYENVFEVPTYKKFYQAVNKYFSIEDITFDQVINYQDYGTDKERGLMVKILAPIFKLIEKHKLTLIKKLLLNFSVGWIFICRQKKH